MISPSNQIVVTTYAHLMKTDERGIRNQKGHQIKFENVTFLINNLKMHEVFKNEDKKRGDGVMNLIYGIVDLLLKEIMKA